MIPPFPLCSAVQSGSSLGGGGGLAVLHRVTLPEKSTGHGGKEMQEIAIRVRSTTTATMGSS